MTLVAVQSQLRRNAAAIYRSITLMSSMADAEVQKLHGRLKDQASGVTRAGSTSWRCPAWRAGRSHAEARTGALMRAYHARLTSAIDLASVDPNTGISYRHTGKPNRSTKEVAALVSQRHADHGAERQGGEADRTVEAVRNRRASCWPRYMLADAPRLEFVCGPASAAS